MIYDIFLKYFQQTYVCCVLSYQHQLKLIFFIKGNKDDLVHDAAPAPDDDEG